MNEKNDVSMRRKKNEFFKYEIHYKKNHEYQAENKNKINCLWYWNSQLFLLNTHTHTHIKIITNVAWRRWRGTRIHSKCEWNCVHYLSNRFLFVDIFFSYIKNENRTREREGKSKWIKVKSLFDYYHHHDLLDVFVFALSIWIKQNTNYIDYVVVQQTNRL